MYVKFHQNQNFRVREVPLLAESHHKVSGIKPASSRHRLVTQSWRNELFTATDVHG